MFSLRDYLIQHSENTGSTISYDEKWVTDTIQRVYAATLTWAKGLRLKDTVDAIIKPT
jgi:hypothetical protein